MGRNYQDELSELRETYSQIRKLDDDALADCRRAFDRTLRRNAVFVGSGGTLALAELAHRCQVWMGGRLARVETPLGVAGGASGRVTDADVVLFSARARHPDVRLAARAVRAQPANTVTLVTHIAAIDIDPKLGQYVDHVVHVPRTSADGFLATNSVLAIGAAWVRSAGITLPDVLPAFDNPEPSWPSEATRALILYGPLQYAAALDLEARLSETGLADVQLADYRNLAHGRHVGLLSRSAHTAVIYLVGPDVEELAKRTARVLPASLLSTYLSTSLEGPAGTVDLMVLSMMLLGSIGTQRSANPGAPRVSANGRRLYHLPWSKLAHTSDGALPARLKALEADQADPQAMTLSQWIKARDLWLASASGAPIEAIVLDHDGTCVTTERRIEPPDGVIQAELIRLLDANVRVGFASGRGSSLLAELRAWVPRHYWERMPVALYNGAIVTTLGSEVERSIDLDDVMREVTHRLESGLIGDGWSVTAREHQVTVERGSATGGSIAGYVQTILSRHPAVPVKVLASGHSADVVQAPTTKTNILRYLLERGVASDRILTIGDQGHLGGNDFELLAASPLSLSVDRVSSDPTRCWNLSADGRRGPDLLRQYLQSVTSRASGSVVFRPRPPARKA